MDFFELDKRGYIALWRKIQDHKFYKEKRVFSKYEAWIDILMHAQHEIEPQQVVFGMKCLIQNYGECLKSNRTWGKRWNWSEHKVRRFMRLLKKMDQIEQKSEGFTSRITVLNYDKYDPRRRTKCRKAVARPSTNNNVKKKEKEIKKEKERKNWPPAFSKTIEDPRYQKTINYVQTLEKIKASDENVCK